MKDSEGEPRKFEDMGGGGVAKSSKVIRGDHLSEVTFKGRIG